ncbi:UDP-glycosyltransferase [Hwangdonia lutea]|uniref:UDP-glycosyltransferase n=1 Tax=Hwangdonia lutea TaxID=3075823 RepID=A0AA97HQW0_9FLAO|nr:UDP-glycosyltransferase [Hwangdonia sp. SCSIO 19198]WOD43967.1 UDP-glycosyltransferase [Hwangdonia sp. SCSIO 19198]
MNKKKIFVLLPDGGGLRNFVFSSFNSLGSKMGYDITYWSSCAFPIKETFNYKELKIGNQSTHPLTPIYSRARKRIELNISRKDFNDKVYDTYKFPLNFKGIKNSLKSIFILFLITFYGSKSGLNRLKRKVEKLERKNDKYQLCKQQLEEHKPDLVFCTNQRNTQALSALLAAKDLGIKTVCFVQSWDNVPKAMQVLETDYYFVWSHLMKKEMLKYYPFIKKEEVIVTGTPQFEMHYDKELLQPKDKFFKKYNLDIETKYICFSGDDKTTSPLDQYYLEDLAKVVRSLNSKGEKLGIIYRKCPFDISDRYNEVLENNKDVIRILDPYWKQINNTGDMLPTKEDSEMLYNVCEHSEFVTNVCSSTVFDFVAHHKSCIYYNYEQPQLKKGIRDIGQNYNYVHFRSMPSKDAVIFCEDKTHLESLVLDVLYGKKSNVAVGLKWYKIVVGETPTEASKNMWSALSTILNGNN